MFESARLQGAGMSHMEEWRSLLVQLIVVLQVNNSVMQQLSLGFPGNTAGIVRMSRQEFKYNHHIA